MDSSVSYIEINLKALINNLAVIKRYQPNRKILAMLKANAYGHGLITIASILNDQVDALGIMHINDAVALRNANITKPIVLLGGFMSEQELKTISDLNLATVIHDDWQINILNGVQLKKPVNIWLKVNTGMNRLGFDDVSIHKKCEIISNSKNVKQPICLITHFGEADNLRSIRTQQQLTTFYEAIKGLVCETSLYNSAAIINYPKSSLSGDWIRPGLLLYGISPIGGKIGQDFGLQSVMNYYSRLIVVRKHRKGDSIGYGNVYKCPEDNMPIGIIPIGYADGYPRHMQESAPILINGFRCRLIARVSMHMTYVDLRNFPHAKPGDKVEFWGENLPVEEVAEYAATIPNELMVRIPSNINRILKKF